VSGRGRGRAAVRHAALGLVPAGRRQWVEAVWAEAPEVPPGLRRLAWQAGGVRLIAREAVMVRRIGGLLLFAAAMAAAAWAAWPGSSPSLAAPTGRLEVITMVLLLAGLPLLAAWLLGPPDNRTARLLRVGCYVAILSLLPTRAAVEQVLYAPPRGGTDLRLYLLIAQLHIYGPSVGKIVVSLAILGLYLAAIVSITSRRARIAPATLAVGAHAGIALGVVMYLVAPLGLSSAATNPWLPGSDVDPLVLLAWLMAVCAPATAAVIADRRYLASSSAPPTGRARICQLMAAGLLTSLVAALFVTAAGYGTTAVMLKTSWLRNWLYHGQHLLYGVQNLSGLLRTLPAISYSHELTGASDASAFFLICIVFPLIAVVSTGFVTGVVMEAADSSPGNPRPGGGGPPGPGPAPVPPDGGRPAVTDDDVSLPVGLADLQQPGPSIEQDRLMAAG
jgi:hypothetical protein